MQIKIEVSGNIAVVTEKPEVITTGTKGLPVLFTFDESWKDLQNTAVFRCGKISSVKAEIGTVTTAPWEVSTTVPWEVLKKPNTQLSIGVYGVNTDGTFAIPTVWANVDNVKPGADPEAEPGTDPALPVYQQLINDVNDLWESLDWLEADTANELADLKKHFADLNREANATNEKVDSLQDNVAKLEMISREELQLVKEDINILSARVYNLEISGGGGGASGGGTAPLIVIYEARSGKASHTSAEIYEASWQRPVLLEHDYDRDLYHLNYCNEFYASFVKLGDDRLYEEWIVDVDGNVEYFNHGFIANTEQIGKVEGAVLYTPQALTEEQQAQARENIGAADAAELPVLVRKKVNLLTTMDILEGKFVSGAGLIDDSNYNTTELIPLKPGESLAFTGKWRAYAVLDKNMTRIDGSQSEQTNFVYTNNTDDSVWVRGSYYYSRTTLMVTYSDTVPTYDPNYSKFENGVLLNEEQIQQINESLGLPLPYEYKNMLTGKKWVACGDSFTYGGDGTMEAGLYAGKPKSYPYFIGNRCGMDVVNEAVPGSTMTYLRTQQNAFSNLRYKEIPADAEYITLKFGINDDTGHQNAPIGTIDDTTNATFYGAWNVVMEHLITNHPTAHIGIIVTNGGQLPYVEATIAIAKKWGIPYLNMATGEQVPLPIRSNRTDVCGAAKNVRLNTFRVSETDLHPNALAHEYESRYIEAWLMTI